jgi:glycosidase
LKVIMDIVFAHSANDNVLLNKPGFYQRTPDGALIMSRWRTPMPDYTNLRVREYFRNNMLHWVRDVGLDGFRADVAGGVPTDFWDEARDAMDKVNLNVVMLAEADVPEHQLKAFDISYNFPYYAALTSVVVNGESAERIRQQWQKAKDSFPRGARFLHLNDNHDRNRAAVVFGEKAALATSVLNFTLDGIPFLYNGEEVGDTTAPQQQSHVAIRWDIWKPESQRRTSIAGQQNAKLRIYKQIIQMRREEAALTSGELTWVDNSNLDGVVSFIRKKGNEEILVLINLTNRIARIQVDVPASNYAQARDLLKNRTLPASLSPDKFSCQLGAFDYVVAKRTAMQTP